jgi:N-acetylmuramoyl-L-alanine amidase
MDLQRFKWWWGALALGWIVSILLTVLLMRPAQDPGPIEIRESRPPEDPAGAPTQAFDWTAQPEPAFPIPPYASYLSEARIVIDPGHGGRKHLKPRGWKTGPTGLREAEVNLSVGLYLAEFLEAAGAQVRLTRTTDNYLERGESADLRARAAIANDWPADALISLHHNAVANPQVNYSQVFYHADGMAWPATLTLGHHVQLGLQDALRLEQQIPCALLSDFLIYPEKGFGILRAARTPAVLVEASFFTNPAEEARLRDPLYNRREAYGLFLGLARWVQAGLPRIRLAKGSSSLVMPGQTLRLQIQDGLSHRPLVRSHEKVLIDSLFVRIAGQPVAAHYDAATQELEINVSDTLPPGRQILRVDFFNLYGQPPIDPYLPLTIGG